jgi:hypothetical protein
MVDLLSRLSPAELPVVLCLGLLAAVVCVIGVANIAAGSLRRYWERKLATSVVLEMLNRQMPFDQIRDVILALDMEDGLDRACTLRRDGDEVSIDSDLPNGEAPYCVRLTMPSPQPTRLSSRNAMWLPQRVAL